nr:hypothetical protein [Vibrio cidicii]
MAKLHTQLWVITQILSFRQPCLLLRLCFDLIEKKNQGFIKCRKTLLIDDIAPLRFDVKRLIGGGHLCQLQAIFRKTQLDLRPEKIAVGGKDKHLVSTLFESHFCIKMALIINEIINTVARTFIVAALVKITLLYN